MRPSRLSRMAIVVLLVAPLLVVCGRAAAEPGCPAGTQAIPLPEGYWCRGVTRTSYVPADGLRTLSYPSSRRGTKFAEGHVSGGSRTGIWKWWLPTGVLFHEAEFAKGNAVAWCPPGTVFVEQTRSHWERSFNHYCIRPETLQREGPLVAISWLPCSPSCDDFMPAGPQFRHNVSGAASGRRSQRTCLWPWR